MNYNEFSRKFNISLNDYQKQAVTAVDGNVLLLAVPGSGKTTVLITRLGYMILCCGIKPESILTMTYTVAAAAEMSARFAAVFGKELADRLQFRTINGVCARIIRRYEQTRNTKAFPLVEDEKLTGRMIADIWRRVTGTHPDESDIRSVRTAVTYAKNMMLSSAEDLDNIKDAPKNFSLIFNEYRRMLREQELMDYDDQLQYALTILRTCPDILEALRGRYCHICVDEAQDTSKIQHVIIDLLAGDNGSLFMVGDEDQSIYGFRAACPEALVHFESTHRNAKVLLLETNYRSTPEIVRTAENFIKLNKNRHEKAMYAACGSGSLVREIPVRDRIGQYAYLQKVAENCDTETAVLYRDNDSALPLIDHLSRSGIPYRAKQVDSVFFTHRVVADITDIIRFANDPTDGALFLNIYYKLNARLTRVAAENAARHCPPGVSVLKYASEEPDISEYCRSRCGDLQNDLTVLLKERGDQAVRRITEIMGYGEFMQQRRLDTGKAEILKALGRREPDALSLLRRLDELKEIVRQGSTDPNGKFILSTIHSSKGLEYDRVFLLDIYDGVLPPDTGESNGDSLEEERRIFYVGMTRAKKELAIFTFTDRAMTASFSDAVFGKNVKPQNAERKHSFGVLPLHKLREHSCDKPDMEQFVSGTRIEHKSLGTGVVIKRLPTGMITVDFNGVCKKLHLRTAIEKDIISIKE